MAKSVPMANTNDLISSIEAAELLGVGRSTLTRWVQSGRLTEAMKLPGDTGARLFRRTDVEALRSPTAGRAAS
jgi:excisionase family DNA binding protein